MLLIPGHRAERPAAPEQQDHPRDSAAFQAISGFSLLPMERELGRLLRKEGAGKRQLVRAGQHPLSARESRFVV